MPMPPRPISPRRRYLPATTVPGARPRSRGWMVAVREGGSSPSPGQGFEGGAGAGERESEGGGEGEAQRTSRRNVRNQGWRLGTWDSPILGTPRWANDIPNPFRSQIRRGQTYTFLILPAFAPALCGVDKSAGTSIMHIHVRLERGAR